MKLDQLPGIPPLFLALIRGEPSLGKVFSISPHCDALRARAVEAAGTGMERHAISLLLKNQAARFRSSIRSLDSIALLRDPGTTVVLFELPCEFLGGTMSVLLKCLSAIKVSRALTQMGIPSIPLGWIRFIPSYSGDQNCITVLDDESVLREICREGRGTAGGGVFEDYPLPRGIEHAIANLGQVLGRYVSKDVMDLLLRSYEPESQLSLAYGRFLSELFADWGLVILDPRDSNLNEMFQPLLTRIVRNPERVSSLLRDRASQLMEAGYLLSERSNGAEIPTMGKDGLDSLLSGRSQVLGGAPGDSLNASAIAATPGNSDSFSTPLIPFFLASLLPVAAYLAEPDRMEELALFSSLSPELNLPCPLFIPRLSASIIDKRVRGILEKYNLAVVDLYAGNAALAEKVSAIERPIQAYSELKELAADINHKLPILAAGAAGDEKLSADVHDSERKMLYQIDKLLERLTTADAQRRSIIGRQVERACNYLAPRGMLQENCLGAVFFLCRYAPDLLHTMEMSLDPWNLEHQLILAD